MQTVRENPVPVHPSLSLRDALLELERKYSHAGALQTDPILFAHRYEDPPDRETAALIAALFAYGNVKAMKVFLEKLFKKLGRHPARTISNIPGKILAEGLYYRFQKESDIALFLDSLRLLTENASGENLFEHYFLRGFLHASVKERIFSAVNFFEKELIRSADYILKNEPERKNETSDIKNYKGFLHLAGDGTFRGGARKRYMLFLRWMVRKGFPDLGIYKKIRPSDLVIPLDVHMARTALRLGLTKRKSADAETALEITESLRRMDPDDPLRFDFILTRPGITGECRVNSSSACKVCPLQGHCSAFR